MQDKSAAGGGFTLRVAASFNISVNADLRGYAARPVTASVRPHGFLRPHAFGGWLSDG